ncbi:CMRF35-like molecule 6 [Erpetoichthys calabaricus]|uniref:CMRF35-like molecule 6 n=1 Tax=Erpetoichthys calabaricus TaxID=27687 RepID=UPI00109F32C2|nr:CMRF35-like molecule 6 [Erpetoichthys calabaricus]
MRWPELMINLLFAASSYARLTEGIIFRGSEGGRLEIKCKYDCERKLNNKYFCQHPCSRNEQVIIKSSKPENLTINGRFSIFDYTSSCYFTVMVDKARATDSGRHYCGIEVFFLWDDYTEVLIDVTKTFCLRQGSAVQPTSVLDTEKGIKRR